MGWPQPSTSGRKTPDLGNDAQEHATKHHQVTLTGNLPASRTHNYCTTMMERS